MNVEELLKEALRQYVPECNISDAHFLHPIIVVDCLNQAIAELAKRNKEIEAERVRNLEILLQYKKEIRILKAELAKPGPTEFTKIVRLNVGNWENSIQKDDCRVRSIIAWLKESCNIIDSQQVLALLAKEPCKTHTCGDCKHFMHCTHERKITHNKNGECSDWQPKCKTCGGTREVKCKVCRGTGGYQTSSHPCCNCDGKGKIPCPDCQPEPTELGALSKTLEIYAETNEPITQHFYQGLCLKAKEAIDSQQTEIEQYRWIPVSERLPDRENEFKCLSEEVLVCGDIKSQKKTSRYNVDQGFWLGGNFTRWKPII